MPDARSTTPSQTGAMSPPSTPSNNHYQPTPKRPPTSYRAVFYHNRLNPQQVQSPQQQQQNQYTSASSTTTNYTSTPFNKLQWRCHHHSSTSPIQKVDTNDLQDVLHSTGIDLKAEEAALSEMLTLPQSGEYFIRKFLSTWRGGWW